MSWPGFITTKSATSYRHGSPVSANELDSRTKKKLVMVRSSGSKVLAALTAKVEGKNAARNVAAYKKTLSEDMKALATALVPLIKKFGAKASCPSSTMIEGSPTTDSVSVDWYKPSKVVRIKKVAAILVNYNLTRTDLTEPSWLAAFREKYKSTGPWDMGHGTPDRIHLWRIKRSREKPRDAVRLVQSRSMGNLRKSHR